MAPISGTVHGEAAFPEKPEEVHGVESFTDDYDGEMVPLGIVLREVELDVREQALHVDGYAARLERHLSTERDQRMRAAVAALLNGKPVSDWRWRLLAEGVIEQMHRSFPERDRKRCSPKGCRFCSRGAA